jgi:hypothetical protein
MRNIIRSPEQFLETHKEIQDGEEVCETCSGKGFFNVFTTYMSKDVLPCASCGGTGKVWWTEKATGINGSLYFEYLYCGTFGSGSSGIPGISGQIGSSGILGSSGLGGPTIPLVTNASPSVKVKSRGKTSINLHRSKSTIFSNSVLLNDSSKKSYLEAVICHVFQRSLKTIKYIWFATYSQLLCPVQNGIEKIVKCFKMVLT